MPSQGTVLVVDDDPAIIELVQIALGDAGYTAIAASNSKPVAWRTRCSLMSSC